VSEEEVKTESAVDSEESASSKTTFGPKLSPKQWAEIRHSYEMGEMRAAQLAHKYGVSASAVSQHFTRYVEKTGKQLIFGRIPTEATEKAAKAAEEEKVTFATKRLERVEKSLEEGYQATSVLYRLNMEILIDIVKTKTPPAMHANDFKALRNAEASLREVLNQRYKLLKIDENVNPDELPQLPILDYNDDMLKNIREGKDIFGAVDPFAEIEVPEEEGSSSS
jgi:hypothetical protein